MKLEDYLDGKLVSTFDEMVDELRNECAMDEKIKKNEFGEKVEAITYALDYRLNALKNICDDVQINTHSDTIASQMYRLRFDGLDSVDDGKYYIVTIAGGAGTHSEYNWLEYLMLIRKVFQEISDKFYTGVWLEDWNNERDCDRWKIRIGFNDNTEKKQYKEHRGGLLKGINDLINLGGKKGTIKALQQYIEKNYK